MNEQWIEVSMQERERLWNIAESPEQLPPKLSEQTQAFIDAETRNIRNMAEAQALIDKRQAEIWERTRPCSCQFARRNRRWVQIAWCREHMEEAKK